MRILHMIVAALLMTIAHPAMARADAWTVSQRSGDVQVLRPGLTPASVQVRAALAPGDVIVTGASGRAMLTRGGDYVIVAPRSRLQLPTEQKQTGFTRLVQQVGTMFYKVRHTGVPHFAVETPMLAAVVKGTSFTVVVDENRVAVQVTEGLVEVKSASGEATRLVEGGLTVYVGRERPNEIFEMNPGSADTPNSARTGNSVQVEGSGAVSLASITDLTGGLIREALIAPALPTAQPAGVLIGTLPGTPVASPVAPAGPVAQPVAGPVQPVVQVGEPVANPVVAIAGPAVGPVVEFVAPVVEPIVAVVEPVVTPVVEPIVAVVEPVVTPVVEPIVAVVEPVVAPVIETVVGILDPIVQIVEPVVEPVVAIVDPVIEVVAPVVEPVIAIVNPVIEIVEPVVEPVVGILDPVITIVEPVVEPLVEIVEPVTGPILGGLLSGL